MRNKVKTYKVKNKDKEEFIRIKRAFLWHFVKEQTGKHKSKVTLTRGKDTVTNRKGYKKVKKYEKWYYQLLGKRAPVAAIIFTLLLIGAIVPIFIIDMPVVKVVLIGAASIIGAVTLFVWLAYLMTMIKKKKLLKYLIAESHKYDAHPEEVISPENKVVEQEKSEEINENVAEAYLQGDEPGEVNNQEK